MAPSLKEKNRENWGFIPMNRQRIANWILPPALKELLRLFLRSHQFSGSYPSWNDAVRHSEGYNSHQIFETVRDAARAVRDGKALWERDSVLFHHEEYNYPLLTCLLRSAIRHEGRLHVLDFGGALGSTYVQNRRWLEHIPELSWTVVEQPHIVTCGEEEFATDTLSFAPTLDVAFDRKPITLVLFSSVLQYLESPYTLLEDVAARPVDILLDRTPFAQNGERITVQRVPPSIYPASYPCRFLDRQQVAHLLQNNQRTLGPWFQSTVDPEDFIGVMAETTPASRRGAP